MPVTFEITPASSPAQVEIVRALFTEYAQSLGFSLCFQGFDREIAELPGKYAGPKGRLLLGTVGEEVAGCVALRPIEGGVCELKRLYVKPDFRSTGLGRALMDRILSEAREIGYDRMQLDTVSGQMDRAIAMYRKYGFREMAPRSGHPVPGTIYMELEL